MMLEVLYLLTTCSVGLPCPAPLFKRNMEPQAFQYTREVCLTAARAYDADKAPRRAAYCAGNDGIFSLPPGALSQIRSTMTRLIGGARHGSLLRHPH